MYFLRFTFSTSFLNFCGFCVLLLDNQRVITTDGLHDGFGQCAYSVFCVHLCDAEQSTFAGAFLPDIGFTRRKCGVQHRDIVGFFILEHEIKRIRINNGVLNFYFRESCGDRFGFFIFGKRYLRKINASIDGSGIADIVIDFFQIFLVWNLYNALILEYGSGKITGLDDFFKGGRDINLRFGFLFGNLSN